MRSPFIVAFSEVRIYTFAFVLIENTNFMEWFG